MKPTEFPWEGGEGNSMIHNFFTEYKFHSTIIQYPQIQHLNPECIKTLYKHTFQNSTEQCHSAYCHSFFLLLGMELAPIFHNYINPNNMEKRNAPNSTTNEIVPLKVEAGITKTKKQKTKKTKNQKQKLTIFLADKFPTSTPFKRKPSGRQGLILFC